MADDSVDIATLIRQRQLMDQLNQITSQGVQSDIIQPGLKAFDDTGGGSQTTSTGVTQPTPRRGGGLLGLITGQSNENPLAKTKIPVVSQAAQMQNKINQAMSDKLRGALGVQTPVPPAQDVPVGQRPTLNINTPANQPTLQRGQQISIDPNTGQPIAIPNPLLRQYNPNNLGQ